MVKFLSYTPSEKRTSVRGATGPHFRTMRFTYFAGLLAVASAAKTSFVMPEDGTDIVETLRRVPDGWKETGVPSPNMKMRFRIAVRSVRLSIKHAHLGACIPPLCFEATRYGLRMGSKDRANIFRPIDLFLNEHSWRYPRQGLHVTASTSSVTS